MSHRMGVCQFMFVEIVLRRPREPTRLAKLGECGKYESVPGARAASGATELVRQSCNVNRTRVATLNVDQAKDELWSLLDEKTAEVTSRDAIIVVGNQWAHSERILEYADSHNLTIMNTVFRKRDSHLISFYSGNTKTQVDFVLVKNRDRSLVTDAKIVPYETVVPQHRPLVCTFKITTPRVQQVERCDATRIEWWRMREKEAALISRVRLPTVTTVDETWRRATDAILQAARSELCITKPGRKVEKKAWLWTDDVKEKVGAKKALYHLFLGDKTADNWQKNFQTPYSGIASICPSETYEYTVSKMRVEMSLSIK
ncbi:unnamed protein product [Heligmosomoides polygyrus]|uniref:Endo/exonuclease/phosphatase domain-containing protein n=1 Tax=Heligmosomoides polygyrus TaxID=6339 RepID=A0A3P7ZPB3_HELPZ|nr:unnamed protein product [Heligmosomoides polygyrus]